MNKYTFTYNKTQARKHKQANFKNNLLISLLIITILLIIGLAGNTSHDIAIYKYNKNQANNFYSYCFNTDKLQILNAQAINSCFEADLHGDIELSDHDINSLIEISKYN